LWAPTYNTQTLVGLTYKVAFLPGSLKKQIDRAHKL
jgi:hypothetical protein